MQKKLLSFFLCLVTILTTVSTAFAVTPASAATPTVRVYFEDEEISSISVPQNEKKMLTAKCDYVDGAEFQWQILADIKADLWVDIQGQSKSDIEVSKALVRGVMDSSNSAYIRAATVFAGEKLYSEPVCVTINDIEAPAEAEKKLSKSKLRAVAENIENAISPLADDDDDNVYVIINYLDAKTGDEMYTSYSCQLKKGENNSFTQTVLSPTWLGYAPKYCADDTSIGLDDVALAEDDASQIEINLTINEETPSSIVYNVYYKAIDVPYAAKFFYQNLYDDMYTEDAGRFFRSQAETGTIIDDSILNNVGDKPGFSALYHYPDAVAADGSTVFECYYDRNYYLMKFDMNGGYGTDPIYARFGTPFLVNTPDRPGYRFVGWDKLDENGNGNDTADTLPTTIPAENQSYKAIWEKTEATYTIIYWAENADDPDYSFWGYRTVSAFSGDTYPVNSDPTNAEMIKNDEIKYFTYNPEKSDKTVTVKGDGSTIANVYFTRNKYTLVFYDARRDSSDYLCGYTSENSHVHDDSCTNLCGMQEHTHDKICYGIANNATSQNPKNAPQNPKQGQIYVRNNNRYIYIGTSWYLYSEKLDDGSIASPTCQKEEHTHSSSCYSCGKVEHVHDDKTCYKGIQDNPKITPPDMTVGDVNNANVLYTITAKYQQDISKKWPYGPTTTDEKGNPLDYWLIYNSVNGDTKGIKQTSKVVKMTANICDTNDNVSVVKAYYNTLNKRVWNVYYYFESLDQASLENGNDRIKYNNIYYDADPDYTETLTASNSRFVHKDVVGMKPDVIPPSANGWNDPLYYNTNTGKQLVPENIGNSDLNITAHFIYSRDNAELSFYNYNGTVSGYPKTVKHGASLVSYKGFEPTYPEGLEANAYEFAGWYTSPACVAGSEVDFDKQTVPIDGITLYAKWAPVKHTVNFFFDEDDMNTFISGGTTDNEYQSCEVEHGNVVSNIQNPISPDNKVKFAGWFFYENGVKKAYTPLDFPVVKNMNVFAEWSSQVAQPYVIHYVLFDDPDTKVADDTKSFAYQGTTKTFSAKAGEPFNQLYSQYNSGYFPTVATHSITMQPDDKLNPTVNVYTFYYVKVPSVPYMVRYVDAKTGEELAKPKIVNDNQHSVVTERFKPIKNYSPDNFYKRIVIQYDKDNNVPENNVITFYYTYDETVKPYAVHYMLQKLGTTGDTRNLPNENGDYFESSTRTEGVTDQTRLDIIPPGFVGYDVQDKAREFEVDSNGEITEKPELNLKDGKFVINIYQNGTDVYVYYILKTYKYTVEYRDYNNPDNELAPKKTVENNQFGASVTEKAIDITGYNCVSVPPEITITISSNEENNVIKFWYTKLQYIVEYKVWENGGGKVSLPIETVEETDFEGSVPTANEGYVFEGWYENPECTIPVKDKNLDWVNAEDRLTPEKDGLKPVPEKNIYYAKFTPVAGDLTIVRNNSENEGNGKQVFVYKVYPEGSPDDAIFVTITGNGEKTIHGLTAEKNYIVEQQNDWSWRFDDGEKKAVIEAGKNVTVTFNEGAKKVYGLNGNSDVKKNVKSKKGGTD